MADPERTYERAMFPLGSVLVPTAVLPLHLFEPRYLALIEDVRASDHQELGVVLIERGSEVGGGEVRTDVGTVARVVRAESFDDGRWAVVAVGVRRVRVVRWLDDDPYPRAELADWPDAPEDEVTQASLVADVEAARQRLRTALALAAELGDPAAPATVEVADDPRTASFQVIALAPIGPADQQALLALPGAGERARRLVEVLDDAVELMRARLALG